MKKLMLLFALLSAAVGASAANPTLYGVKLYCEGGCSSGLYSLDTTPGSQPQLEWASGDMMGNGGSVYVDGTLYILNYLDFYGTLYWWYLICDVESQSMESEMPELTFADTGSAMTYDPTTGNAYSICIDANDTSKFTLSTMNLADGSKTVVAPIQRMGALAADQHGTLFGIGMDGKLYKVNKFTGELALIGSTGLSPQNNQSAVIDYATGTLYWNAITADGAYLYSVDTSTAKATLITELDNRFQFAGFFIKQSAAQEGAPEAPADLTAAFAGASLSGTLIFTMPQTDTDGNALGSELTYTVKCGDAQMAEGKAAPGAKVSVDVEVDEVGSRQFFVTVRNQSGTSAPASVNLWVGMDTPKKVEDCTVTNDGGTVRLSWTLPATGVNGGYVDPSLVRYVVLRGPYGELLESELNGTTYTETYSREGVHPLMYGVSAYIDPEAVTEMVMSNVIVMGDYWDVPFAEDLTDPFRSLVFTVHDANGDECTWEYDYDFAAMRCMWPLADESDDWLVSAPVKLEADKKYEVAATVRSEGKWNYDEECYDPVYSGNLGIYLGTSASYDTMTRQLLEPTEVSLNEEHQVATAAFSPEADGVYYIGLHHSGVRSIYYMIMSRLEVREAGSGSVESIERPENVTYRLMADGIAITNPSRVPMTLTAIDGRTVLSTTEAEAAATLPTGVYILTTPSRSAKIILP